ncbi:hypothetical protein JTB14_013409 [Gonioctena quinquepunctata]|nr:hypothetical protein JTB14_013409 [Gonioctena quinquepunctata]
MILCDTPSTSTKLIQVISRKCDKSSSSTQPYEPDIVIEIPEQNNSSNSIGGNAGSSLLTPYLLLKQTGIAKRTITPKKKKMYGAMKQLRKKYTIEMNKKKSFRRRLSEAEQFRDTHHLEENIGKLNNMASMLIQCQLRESQESKKLRRFTLNEKLLALFLYEQSVKSHSVLSKIFNNLNM